MGNAVYVKLRSQATEITQIPSSPLPLAQEECPQLYPSQAGSHARIEVPQHLSYLLRPPA
jgi:hypothetical protein